MSIIYKNHSHDKKVWRLHGHEITRLLISYMFEIEIGWRDTDGDHGLNLTIYTPFIIQMEESVIRCEPGRIETLQKALELLHQPVSSLTVWRSGRLELRLESGIELIIEKDLQYESWDTYGTGALSDANMLCSAHEGPPWIDE